MMLQKPQGLPLPSLPLLYETPALLYTARSPLPSPSLLLVLPLKHLAGHVSHLQTTSYLFLAA